MSSAHDGQDASVRNILVDHRHDGFELAISEVFVQIWLRRTPSAADWIAVFSIVVSLGGRSSSRKETAALLAHARPPVDIGQ